MLKLLSSFLFSLLAFSSYAEEIPSEQELYREIANDLTSIQNLINATYPSQTSLEIPQYVTITADEAALSQGAEKSTPVIYKAKKGQEFIVIDKVSDWYAIDFSEHLGEDPTVKKTVG